MNAPGRIGDWSDANQRVLVAEFRRLGRLLGAPEADAAAEPPEAMRQAMPAPAAIDRLAGTFRLTTFERDLLLLAAGVEMDGRIAALCAAARGELSPRPWASFALALAVLPEPHWSALTPAAPLRRWRLIEVEEAAGLSEARLRIDERVLHFLAGVDYLDHRLEPLVEPVPPPGAMSTDHRAIVERAVAWLTGDDPAAMRLALVGDDEGGQADVAAAIAARLGLGLCRLRAADVPAAAAEQAAFATLWSREAVLLGCGLVIRREEGDPAMARLAARLDGLVILAGADRAHGDEETPRFRVDRPDLPERRRLWHAALGAAGADRLGQELDALAGRYRLGARQIDGAAAAARATEGGADFAALDRAGRAAAGAMPALARRLDVRAGWGDLVLPEAQLRTLGQIAAHVRHRLTVHHDWGFADKSAAGLGIASLFWGDSGTGKTLAAEVLAGTLGLPLYRIDLSAVVSKYIGETEKNLARLFDAAEDAGAILLFDEADALFGKRSDVKDSHDRYANIEVSYLLQRMEAYSGLAILTTNHKATLDAAFLRRLRFVVHFPFPDQAQREGIWRTIFPAGVPRAGLDYARLARLDVAGGTIRNIALSAAFLAAEAGTPVRMAELLAAAHLEAAKRDKPYSDAETRGWT